MRLTTTDELYDEVRTRIGKLARRIEEPLANPSPNDEDALKEYTSDGIHRVAKVTDRLNTSAQLFTTPSKEFVERPEHMDVIDEVALYDAGTPYELDIEDGQVVARDARAPNATEDRPCRLGAYDGKLYLYPVPDKEYPIDVQFQMNGAFSDSSPAADEPPLLGTLVERVPAELSRALVYYVMAEWLKDTGSPEAAQSPRTSFVRDINRWEDEPIAQSDATVKYNPLSL